MPTRSRQRLVMSVANYDHLVSAFGAEPVRRFCSGLAPMLYDAFSELASITAISPAILELRFAAQECDSSRFLGKSEQNEFLASLVTSMGAMDFAIGGSPVRLVMSGEWVSEVSASPLDSASLALRASGEFTGDPAVEQTHDSWGAWVAGYTSDIGLADELLSGLAPTTRGEMTGWGCLLWRTVRSSGGSSRVLLHELDCGIITAQGRVLPSGKNLAAIGRLGLSGVVCRLLCLRAIEELSATPELAISIRVPARAARPRGELASALSAGLAGAPEIARRLVLEIDLDDRSGTADGLVAFCDGARALGCRIAIGGFGFQSGVIENLLLVSPDIVRIDGSLANSEHPGFGATGLRILEHLAGIAEARGVLVIANGVDREEWAHCLTRIGVQWQQGDFRGHFSVSRPWIAHPASADCALAMDSIAPNGLGSGGWGGLRK